MLKSIRLENFRCFKNLYIEGFERFNLIGGMNNVGKTSLLEGLFLTSGPTMTNLTWKLNIVRGMPVERQTKGIWENFHLDYDITNPINIFFTDHENKSRGITIKLEKQNSLKISSDEFHIVKNGETSTKPKIDDFILKNIYKDDLDNTYEAEAKVKEDGILFSEPSSELLFMATIMSGRFEPNDEEMTDLLSESIRLKQKDELLEVIKIIEPRILDIDSFTAKNVKSIFCDIGFDKFVPLQISGLGTIRFLSILLRMARSKDGIFLLDEIENGFHRSMHEKLIKAIYEFAKKYNVQIFATTHSYEIVKAANKVFQNIDGYPLRYYRLEELKGDIRAVSYNQDDIESAIELNFEVR